jgi:hypothetical protein
MPFNVGGYIYGGTQADFEVYKNLVVRNLIFNMDASAPESYPLTGTSWYYVISNNTLFIIVWLTLFYFYIRPLMCGEHVFFQIWTCSL